MLCPQTSFFAVRDQRTNGCRIQFKRLNVTFVFSKETVQSTFRHIKELDNILFDGNIVGGGASQTKIFDEFDRIYVVFLGGLLDIGRESAGLFYCGIKSGSEREILGE
jgi:hypothetical protein